MTMQTDNTIDPGLTLDEITNRYPETIAVFNSFGVDICCGGAARLGEAAARDGVSLPKLQAALREALAHRAVRSRP